MPRKTKKEQLAEAQDAAAPFLFDEKNLPLAPEVLQSVRRQDYKHTGARLIDNDAKALRLVELLMQGRGLKAIASEMRISKHTVKAAREELVRRGELAPYKERVVRLFEEIVEVGASNYLEALENGEVPPAQIPVGVGIISDKRALALGEPTSIGAQASAASLAEELSVEKLNAYFAGLKRASVDVPSTGSVPEPQQIEGKPGVDASLDANGRDQVGGAGARSGDQVAVGPGGGSGGDGQPGHSTPLVPENPAQRKA